MAAASVPKLTAVPEPSGSELPAPRRASRPLREEIVRVLHETGWDMRLDTLRDPLALALYAVLSSTVIERLLAARDASLGRDEYQAKIRTLRAWDEPVAAHELGLLRERARDRGVDIATTWRAMARAFGKQVALTRRMLTRARISIDEFELFYKRFVRAVCDHPSATEGAILTGGEIDRQIVLEMALVLALNQSVRVHESESLPELPDEEPASVSARMIPPPPPSQTVIEPPRRHEHRRRHRHSERAREGSIIIPPMEEADVESSSDE